jgi:hypothetical protein
MEVIKMLEKITGISRKIVSGLAAICLLGTTSGCLTTEGGYRVPGYRHQAAHTEKSEVENDGGMDLGQLLLGVALGTGITYLLFKSNDGGEKYTSSEHCECVEGQGIEFDPDTEEVYYSRDFERISKYGASGGSGEQKRKRVKRICRIYSCDKGDIVEGSDGGYECTDPEVVRTKYVVEK